MKKNNLILGGILIFLGLSMFLKNFHIAPADTFLLIVGVFFIHLYSVRKEQSLLIIGGIATLASIVSIISHLNIFRFDISGGVFFIVIGAVFLFAYYKKGINGFLYPGCILPSIGIYSILMNNYKDRYVWPSIFILLGVSLILIYFMISSNREKWTIVLGTVMIGLGALCYGFTLGLFNIDLEIALNFIMPLFFILLGVGILIKNFKRNIR